MGRNKIKIQKLETASKRLVTYSKRRQGIMKKARELSILCDVDLLLILFSPKQELSICLGQNSKFEDIIQRYAELTPQERIERKLECLQALKKACKKFDHEVDIDQLIGLWAPKKPPAPRNKVDLTKEIELGEEMLRECIFLNAGTACMQNSTGGLEYMTNLVIHLLNINNQMKGTKNEIPMPAAGGHQVAMNGPMGCGGNGVMRSLMPPPSTTIRNADVFAASDSASTSAPPMPMPMKEERSLLMDPLFSPPKFNSIDTSDMYFVPSASVPLMPMPVLEHYLSNAAICDADVDDSNLGMGNNDNGLARGGGNAGAA